MPKRHLYEICCNAVAKVDLHTKLRLRFPLPIFPLTFKPMEIREFVDNKFPMFRASTLAKMVPQVAAGSPS